MVNTGRPSRGCYLCRSRRVKCDEKKPGCGNCQRLKRECPGYRPIFDVMHRNETKSTQGKTLTSPVESSMGQMARRRTSPGHMVRSPTHILHQTTWKPRQNSWPSAQTLVEAIQTGKRSIYPPLTAALEERAICFFLANYVLIPHGPVRCGFLGFLVPLMRITPSAILSNSLTAVALATFGNQPNAKMLKPKAEQAYAKALREVTSAVSNPKQALEDSTLAAVLLLGLFESVTYSLVKKDKGWNSWNSHVSGAMALLKIRDPKGPMSPITLELVWTVKAQSTLGSLLNGKVPDIPEEWSVILSSIKRGGGPNICNQLQAKVAKARVECDNLMANAKRMPQDLEKVLGLMRKAEALEQGYLDWQAELTEDCLFKTVGWIDEIPEELLSTSQCFPGKVDRYSEVWTAHIWNLSRGSRLINFSTIVRCAAWLCSPQDYRTTMEYEKAKLNGEEMIRDIIASVPVCLGELPKSMEGPVTGQGFACGEERGVRAKGLSGLFLMWPLFSSASSDFATDAQRAWVLGRIKYVTEELGVSQECQAQAPPTARFPSSLIERDGLKPLDLDDIIINGHNNDMPHNSQEAEQIGQWIMNNSEYPTPSPTSTSSSEARYKAPNEWTTLGSGSVNVGMINGWSQQIQPDWLDLKHDGLRRSSSTGTVIAGSSPESTYSADLRSSPSANYYDNKYIHKNLTMNEVIDESLLPRWLSDSYMNSDF